MCAKKHTNIGEAAKKKMSTFVSSRMLRNFQCTTKRMPTPVLNDAGMSGFNLAHLMLALPRFTGAPAGGDGVSHLI